MGSGEPAAAALRDRVRERFATDRVVFTDSGTSALALAFMRCGERSEGPVALPSYGCFDLASAAVAAGTAVLLYDLDPGTLAPEEDSLRHALDAGAACVVLVHAYGLPLPMRTLVAHARGAGVAVVEDAAQAFGGSADGRPMGGWGDLAVLSFGRGKGVSGGGGGALLAPSDGPIPLGGDLLPDEQRARRGLGNLLVASAQWALGGPDTYGVVRGLPGLHLGETRYREPRAPGPAPSAALGIASRTWDAGLRAAAERRRRAQSLADALTDGGGLRPVTAAGSGEPGYLRFPVLARTERAREVLSSPEAGRLGVMPGYPRPLARLEPLRPRLVEPDASHPGAATLIRQLFTAPVHGRMSADDHRRIRRLLAEASAT